MRVTAILALVAAILALEAAILAEPSVTAKATCVTQLREESVVKIDLPTPGNYKVAGTACFEGSLVVQFWDGGLTDDERALCGNHWVPVRSYDQSVEDPYVAGAAIALMGTDASRFVKTSAVNLTSGETHAVDISYHFDCVLCQHKALVYPLQQFYDYEAPKSSSHYQVHLTSSDVRLTEDVSEDAKDLLKQEVFRLLQPESLDNVQFHRVWLDENRHLQVDFWIDSQIANPESTNDFELSILDNSYVVGVEDVGFCPSGETVGVDGTVALWRKTAFDGVQWFRNATTGAISRRECRFNSAAFRSVWSSLTRWALTWRECASEAEQYANEEHYKQFLDADEVDRRHANILHEFTSAPVNTTTLLKIAELVDRDMVVRNELYEQISRDLVEITATLVLESEHFVATTDRLHLIVADLEGSEPVLGFTLQFTDDLSISSSVDVALNRKPTTQPQEPFALDVSARLAEAHSRLAFVVLWKETVTAQFYELNTRSLEYVEVTVMFPRQGEVSRWSFASYGNHHVDITYDSLVMYNPLYVGWYFDFIVCVAWNNNLRDWSSQGCEMLNIDQGNFSACRCSGKYFALQDGVPIAKYALKKGIAENKSPTLNNPFTAFLKDKIALMVVTAIECLLSLLGLGSIICTAFLFKHWRENAGHKILLHMVLALTCNLVLGFTANFVRMNTDGVGCLVYGVLRHYSFLAMFFWMLVLSLLQMKRLMTVAGAKATTHLILKAAVFAWGMPLVPIIVLLSWNPGFYQTDRFERGYCYPEGIVFQVTVQAPAGLILLVNLGIFVKIVLNIFGCVGEKKITRHSKNEKAEQLNKLKTSMFIFFLFGFSWVFHIFSEERVIVSDFLFEYLFLMTATTHIFVLALFFVVFQESTRNEWMDWIRKIKQ